MRNPLGPCAAGSSIPRRVGHAALLTLRQMSTPFLGTQIDAVYHTALVFGGIEYFFGAGVQTTYPGATHHGRPMEVFPMGRTDLPIEVILEYLESLKQIYTAEVGSPQTSLMFNKLIFRSPTICFSIIVITSLMILPCFWLARPFQSTSPLYHRRC